MKNVAKAAAALSLAAVATLSSSLVYAATCNPRDHGAKADGITKDTAAIQACIDAVAVKGNKKLADKDYGQVVLSGGTFLSGPISLKRGVDLRIEKNATLLASPDRGDFPQWRFAGKDTVQPFVSAVNTEYILITGEGTIDGNGKIWWDYVRGVRDSGVLGTDHPRPMGVLFDHTKHVRMEGVTVQNSGFWQIVPYYADDVVFRGIRITAPRSPNTDAIDPFSSSNIVIDHVFSSVGDDNVAIKSGAINSPGPDAPSRNITITDCTFENGHGLSIGSEIAGGVQNVHAERIHFKGTDQGIRIKSARDRGNDVSNISFKDITMEDVKTAILITEYYPHPAPQGEVASEPVTRLTPKFHNFMIENVTAKNSGSAGYIVGLPESPVLDLTMKNVHLEAKTGLSIAYATVTLDDVTVKPETGEAITIAPTAHVTGK
jgi:polygalacturonase